MQHFGIDIGYNAVKGYNGNKKITFPSVVGTPDTSRFKVIGTDDRVFVAPSGKVYMVGELAVNKSRSILRSESRNWIQSEEYYLLFLASLYELSENKDDISIVSGLPIGFYEDKQKLVDLLSGEHAVGIGTDPSNLQELTTFNVKNVRVIPQPFGTIIDEVMNDDSEFEHTNFMNGKFGVIDCGGKTTNILTVESMQEITRKTQSVNVGGWDLSRAVRSSLMTKFPEAELRDHTVMEIVRTGVFKYYGKEYDVTQVIEEHVNNFGTQITDIATTLWGTGADLDAITITGGGANLFSSHISRIFPHAITVNDPVFANAKGYYKFARRVFK